jgi:uncharacterized cupredoxin-like copper-binding protein
VLARKYLITIMIAGLALAACGSSSKSSDAKTTTTTAAAPKARPKVTITAHDFGFDLPAQIPAGYVDITLTNKGKEQHQVELVKLGSMSFAQFKTAADKTDIGAAKPDTIFVGGPNGAEPGSSTTATVKLDPGKYAITCFIPANSDGKPHAAHGMIGEVTVATTAASTEVAPTADSTIVLGDFSFTVPKGFTGKGTLDISNQGNQVHEMILVKLAPGKTLADAKKFFLTPPGTPPPAGPPPFAAIPGIGGITGISSQQHAWLDLNLTAGKYVLICFFPDTTKGGLPHALEGMVKEFTIS